MVEKKPPTEAEITRTLGKGGIELPPLKFTLLPLDQFRQDRGRTDGFVEARWGDKTARFVFEYKAANTPRVLNDALLRVTDAWAATPDLLPLIIVPYLSEERLLELEAKGVSGIDLCGNGVVLGPAFRIWRSGSPNQYKNSAPIKNIYQGNSSLFARSFLLQREFPSLAALHAWTTERFSGKVEGVSIEGGRAGSTFPDRQTGLRRNGAILAIL